MTVEDGDNDTVTPEARSSMVRAVAGLGAGTATTCPSKPSEQASRAPDTALILTGLYSGEQRGARGGIV